MSSNASVRLALADPEMHLPHAGVVDDDPAAREEDELAPCRRMPPGAVGGDRAGREPRFVADQRVDEGGLPDAGRPEQHAGRAGAERGADGIEAEPGSRRDR